MKVKKGNMNRQAGINGVMKQDEQKKSEKERKLRKVVFRRLTHNLTNQVSMYTRCTLVWEIFTNKISLLSKMITKESILCKLVDFIAKVCVAHRNQFLSESNTDIQYALYFQCILNFLIFYPYSHIFWTFLSYYITI